MNDLKFTYQVFSHAGIDGEGIKVTIGKDVTKIPAYLFYSGDSSSAPKIVSVEFEEGSECKSIGKSAFSWNRSLIRVTIPDSVETIDSYAFDNCISLTSVTIPSSVRRINTYAFLACRGLTEINFNAAAMDDLSSGNAIFSHAGIDGEGIKVTIGKDVTKIPAYLFCPGSYAPKIVSVEFEEGSECKRIGNSAFS
jgi:hypothetical protein